MERKDITNKLTQESRDVIKRATIVVGIISTGALGAIAGSYLSRPATLVKKDANRDGITDYVVTNRLGNETVFYNNNEAEGQPIPSSDLAEKLNRLPGSYEPFRVEYKLEE